MHLVWQTQRAEDPIKPLTPKAKTKIKGASTPKRSLSTTSNTGNSRRKVKREDKSTIKKERLGAAGGTRSRANVKIEELDDAASVSELPDIKVLLGTDGGDGKGEEE
jgi:hypothetical protein